MDNIKLLLGKRIKELRRNKKLTQEQLAEKIGIGTPNISYFETGKYTPALETMQKIARALDVEIYELYLFKQEKSIEDMRKELTNAINSSNQITTKLYKEYKTMI